MGVAIGCTLSASVLAGGCSVLGPASSGGAEVARYAFAGSPSDADQQATIRVLNSRFHAAKVPARAALAAGDVVIHATSSTAPQAGDITALTGSGDVQFRPVLAVYPPAGPDGSDDPTTSMADRAVEMPELGADGSVTARYQLGPVLVDGTALESTATGMNSRNQWEVRPVFKAGADGIDRLNAAAALCSPPSDACPTGQLAVTVDGGVITAPRIEVADFERDQITVSGNYDEHEARTLSVLLDSGALPAPLVTTH